MQTIENDAPRSAATVRGLKQKVNRNNDIKMSHIAGKVKSPLKAIRAHCLSCCAGCPGEVRLCTVTRCDLYTYRLGTNPNRAGIGRKIPTKQGVSEQDGTGLSVDIGGIS
jgi:hypothetical protein